jgi:2-C-methyl-D-erythritol 4-phosphate cytidylyltransferase
MSIEKFVIIVAGGSGSRMKSDIPKQFILLKGKPIMAHTINRFVESNCKVIVVLPKEHLETFNTLILPNCLGQDIQVTIGGVTRFESVKNGLQLIDSNSLVSVHDAVRPFVTKEMIDNSFETAHKLGSAICSVELKDSIREVNPNGNTAKNRSHYRLIQTPQTFQAFILLDAYQQEYKDEFTDDASVVEANGISVHLIEGDYKNIKITTPEDLLVANTFIQ